MTDFKDKVVWITGASSGIGEAMAYAWGKADARLILSSNEPDELDRVVQECRRRNYQAVPLFLDLADTASMAEKAAEAQGLWGCVDILVNNGGISQRSMAKDTIIEVDRKIMEIDYFGHIALTKAVLPYMTGRGSGHIVVTTSVAGLMALPLRSAYCAAKHALHGFFETLRAEVYDDGIRVTLAAPSAVRTDISIKALTENGGRFNRMDSQIDKGITPAQCAVAIVRATARGKALIVLGKGRGKWGVYVYRYFPGLYRILVRRAEVL
ncbi:MAG: SDR family oxidoreductase [Desulfosalsimonadaceae bacterium]